MAVRDEREAARNALNETAERDRALFLRAAAPVLGRLSEVGMIDDALFAQMWVTSRHRGRGLAGRALSQELRRKGVEDEVAQEALEEVDADTEEESARRLVRAKLRSVSTLDRDRATRRLVGMLARKGHSSSIAFRVVRSELDAVGLEGGDDDLDAGSYEPVG